MPLARVGVRMRPDGRACRDQAGGRSIAMNTSQMPSTVIQGPWRPSVAVPPARTAERRKMLPASAPTPGREGLTPAQLVTLEALEIFRWRLAFVRRPLFQAAIPVLFDADDTRFVVIREDGTLDEQPTLRLRS